MKREIYGGRGRVLVIDDNRSIHADFAKVLGVASQKASSPSEAELALFGAAPVKRADLLFDLDFALQGQQGLACVEAALQEGMPYAVAFVDMRMPPGWDGLETIERLWAVDPQLQVVICSAHSDYDWLEVLARLGRADKLLVIKKPFEPVEILQSASALTRKWLTARELKAQMETLENMVSARTQGLEAANRQLRHLATHDALTGLPNRVLLEDRVARSAALADRQGHIFGLVIVDLDRFKFINDTYGHTAGDEVLKEVARRLAARIRNIDTVARLGGDEFLLLISQVSGHEDVAEIAQRILEDLRRPVDAKVVSLRITASIGYALYPADGTTMDGLVAQADAAMYYAKQHGRNSLQCYSPGMSAEVREQVELERELCEALGRGQFELYYQPKVNTATGLIRSAEALLRWRHPELGLVPPDKFIPIAEECGVIGAIGEWVVREACRQARQWQQAGLPPMRIAVNLSAAQFRQGNLVEIVGTALREADLEPQFLEVELTESAVMTDPEDSIGILEQLSRMGVMVSVDDFGTGYSSMNYLRRFPIDKLKIDRSFIAEMSQSAENATIVQAIVSLAHSLRLKVVAEGVETSEQLRFLSNLNCDQYQGHFFSPAVRAEEFEALVRSSDQGMRQDRDVDNTQSKLAVLNPERMKLLSR
jgi:diguanylate cyclase (GGDEF)-like protein